MVGSPRNASFPHAQDARYETTWRLRPRLVREYLTHIPFPIFFVIGAMFGILFAMAVVLMFRVPKASTMVVTQPTTVVSIGEADRKWEESTKSIATSPSTTDVETTHAKLLFVWRPQLVLDRAPSSAAALEEAPTTLASAPVANAAATTTRAAPHNYRVASIRKPASLPANLLSAGL